LNATSLSRTSLSRYFRVPVARVSSALLLLALCGCIALSGCKQTPDPVPNFRESAYISNGGSNTVTVVDLRGLRVQSIVPAVQKLSHLPIVVDPSHGTGKRDKVLPLSRAAVAVGADGLIVEVHNDPDHALSDGAQSVFPEQFDELMAEVRQIAPVVHRNVQEPLKQPAIAKAGK
jgi:hypothetical protein